jgi:hypothetical protein
MTKFSQTALYWLATTTVATYMILPRIGSAAELPQLRETQRDLRESSPGENREKKAEPNNERGIGEKHIDFIQAYTRPGIVAFQGGEWVGNDHLYNLGERLALVVEIISPADLHVSDSDLRTYLGKKLEAQNFQIIATDPGLSTSPPPFLHVLVMAYPLKQQIVAYCGLRLFEPVELFRVKLGKEVSMQAITWERQTVVEAANDAFPTELKRTADDLVNTFIEQWKRFERERTSQKTPPPSTRLPERPVMRSQPNKSNYK